MHRLCKGPLENQCGDCLYETAKEMLGVLRAILDDATGDVNNPDKRLWPIRAANYRAARAAVTKGE